MAVFKRGYIDGDLSFDGVLRWFLQRTAFIVKTQGVDVPEGAFNGCAVFMESIRSFDFFYFKGVVGRRY